jgi:hypothetical protein
MAKRIEGNEIINDSWAVQQQNQFVILHKRFQNQMQKEKNLL